MELMPPEIDVIILQSIRYCVIWPVAWVPLLNPIIAEWICVWINPFIIRLLLSHSFAQFKVLSVASVSTTLTIALIRCISDIKYVWHTSWTYENHTRAHNASAVTIHCK